MKFKDFHNLTHLGAGIIFITSKRKILLLQKTNKRWTFPGGHAEIEETPEQTAIRECSEETGKKVSEQDLKDFLFFLRKKETKPVYSFIVYAEKFKPKLSNEHKNYHWFKIEDVNSSVLSKAFAPYWNDMYLPFIIKNS
jgi:ADP-ribose pyrophosphatase YjhB (NUDIX family)